MSADRMARKSPIETVASGKRSRILIFTDSRGQHKPRGTSHEIFAERLANNPRFEVTSYLCPMKWTTTLDFLERFTPAQLSEYDHIILYTGIVDWSPRKLSSAQNDLYDNKSVENYENFSLNTTAYAKKVVNNKKAVFDRIFGADYMSAHFKRPFDAMYDGEKTINMYGLEAGVSKLASRIAAIPNLIFINSNRFVPGWEGDYTKGRPENIGITEIYSMEFRDALPKDRILDLLQWTQDEVKIYTCDNLHLTQAGSDWIHDRLMDMMENLDRNRSDKNRNESILLIGNGPSARELVKFGLKNLPKTIDTFGMGAAYRYFMRENWWPTYHAWCDIKVVHSHKEAFREIAEDERIPLRKLFVSLPVSDSAKLEVVPHSSTGDFCFRKSIELGYKNIYFIGIEGDYVEEIPESRPLSETEYEKLGFKDAFQHFAKNMQDKASAEDLFKKYLRIITQTPKHNPNYFFDDYQQMGDVYSLPRTQTHVNAWAKTASMTRGSGVAAFNLSSNSKIENFPKISLSGALKRMEESVQQKKPVIPFGFPLEVPRPLSVKERAATLKAAGLGPKDRLASLIIGLKIAPNDGARHRNLRFLLDWIDAFYGDLFEVLIVEQGTESRIGDVATEFRPYVRHEFLYNPDPYNRGWGYNAAARHFTDAGVLALLDTDVLPGANFLDEIIACHTTHKVVSPYSTVYFTEADEADRICDTYSFNGLQREDGVRKPTTLTGGIVIIRRDSFLELKGFEQYTEYAGEDRSLDVTILNHLPARDIRMAPCTYVHLHHATGLEQRPRSKELFAHLRDNYGCRVDPNVKPGEDIHRNCKHANRKQTLQLMIARSRHFGDLDLYRAGQPLAINGQIEQKRDAMLPEDLVFPPTMKDTGIRDLTRYAEKEWAGDQNKLDVEQMSQFYNMFKGERCFIIGNGPSLNNHDLSLLEGEFTFGVNSFYYKTRETGYRPYFYVVEDTSVMHENLEEIRNYYAPFRFFPTSYRDLLPKSPNTFFFRMNRGFYEKSSPNYAVPRFSTDASSVLYCGQSVTYINLQLAFFMGFTEVHLIGMDFDYVIPDSHKRTGDIILSTTDDPNHFHKDYFGAGKTWKDPKLERVGMNYRQAKVAFEAVGRKIFNTTIGGKLEIFDRVDYEALLRDPTTGRKRQERLPATAISAKPGRLPVPGGIPAPATPVPSPAGNDLRSLATAILLDPAAGLARLAGAQAEVDKALAALPAGDPLAAHFRRVRDFARSRTA